MRLKQCALNTVNDTMVGIQSSEMIHHNFSSEHLACRRALIFK